MAEHPSNRTVTAGKLRDGEVLTLAPRIASRSLVRPVSRVWFELSDKLAFDGCVQRSLGWMAEKPRNSDHPRAGVELPKEAWEGTSFDLTDVLGANPAKAFRVDASDGALWVARLDWPDPNFPRTWVSEFFVERRVGTLTRFGAQLTCVARQECPAFDITRPTVIRRILETLSAEADGRHLSDRVSVSDKGEIPDIISLLYDTNRRLPVVIISSRQDETLQISPTATARAVAGAAHVIHLSNEASWQLTRSLGQRMSVFNGAVRLYMPGLNEDAEDPHQHPLWMYQQRDEKAFLRSLSARVLPAAFLREGADSQFPRYAVIRDFVTRSRMAVDPTNDATMQLSTELELLRSANLEATEERDAWQSLAHEEQSRRLQSDAEVERLKSEVNRLETKCASLSYNLDSKGTQQVPILSNRRLTSYDDLEEWAEEVLGDGVYIHQAALKDCRKHGHNNMLGRIESALFIIRDYLSPARKNKDRELREIGNQKLAEIGMEDSACFVDREEARRRPQYSVHYEGETRILYDHIKYGNGYDNSNQIRIYHFWDDQRARFVIAKMPTHLKNNLTS